MEDRAYVIMKNNDKIKGMKHASIAFLKYETKESGMLTNNKITDDEIIKKILLKDGIIWSHNILIIIYSHYELDFFDDFALNDLERDLVILKEQVQQNVNLYDSSGLEELLYYLHEEIDLINMKICFVNNRFASRKAKEREHYEIFFSLANNAIKEIVKLIKVAELKKR